jgi:hypothetical protein
MIYKELDYELTFNFQDTNINKKRLIHKGQPQYLLFDKIVFKPSH